MLLKSAKDLATDSFLDGDFVVKGGTLAVVNKKFDPITNIETWTSAFMIYMSILSEKWPSKAQEYLKYMQSIRLAVSRSFGNGWIIYDEQYRLKKVRFPTSSWGSLIRNCGLSAFFQEIRDKFLVRQVPWHMILGVRSLRFIQVVIKHLVRIGLHKHQT